MTVDDLRAGGRVRVASEADMEALGRAWVAGSEEGQVLLLEGPMGAGKTVFVRGVASGLGLDPHVVQSPTFTLINEYGASGELRLVHSDLYRIEPDDVEGTGLLDLLDAPPARVVVEWPDRLPIVPGNAVTLRLARVADDPGARTVEMA